MISQQTFRERFFDEGYCLDAEVVPRATVAALKDALAKAIDAESHWRREGTDDPLQVVCCPYYSPLFLDALEGPVFDRADALLGAGNIIYSYNNSSMAPGNGNFSSRIHRDSHLDLSANIQSIGVIVLLDDFAAGNGATWLLPHSHLHDSPVSESAFFAEAHQLEAAAGSVLYFHPHLLHAGGVNRSQSQRDALSIGFCKPNMKQRLDLPAVLSQHLPRITSARIRQKIGLQAQPPASVEEFYARGSIWYDPSETGH